MIAVGIMSGTSADGIDLAAIEIGDERPRPRVRLIAHAHHDYAAALRDAVLAVAADGATHASDLALLHASLGDAYADAAGSFIASLKTRPEVIALHGQTVAHRPEARATLQLGDAARVAYRTAVTTIADFRSADVVAGGEGAPLVPFADHVLFADGVPRALLNLGGIANLTLLPSGDADDVAAFDTGPGNVVSDAIARRAGEWFDRDGERARRGRVHQAALREALAHPFFARAAPKSTGREEFGTPFAEGLADGVQRDGGSLDDALATAVELTARSVTESLARETPAGVAWHELVVAGGGARNDHLLARLRALGVGIAVRASDELGIPAEAREAVAFAILGAYRLRGQPNTLPRCTGASRAVSAGAIHRP